MRGSGRGVVLALGVGCAVLASGCDNSGDVVRLAFRTRAEEGSFEYRLLEALVEAFNEEHPAVQVVLTEDRLKLEYLMRSIIAREAADVIEVCAEEVDFLARRGAVTALTADCMWLREECDPHAWALGSVGHQVYAIPWAARPTLLLYDKAQMPAGRPPADWEELLRVAERAAARAPEMYGFALAGKRSSDLGKYVAMLLAQQGESLLRFRDGRLFFNIHRPQGRRAMRFLLDLQKTAPPECVVTDAAAALKEFHAGRAAMVVAGPEGLYCPPNEGAPRAVGAALFPPPAGGQPSCEVESRLLCIPAFVRGGRRAAAVAFVEFMAGREAQERVAAGVAGCTPVISIRRDVLAGDAYGPEEPRRVFAASLRTAAPVFPWYIWEGRCAKEWIGGIHSLLTGDRRGIREVVSVANTKGNQALSCLYTDIDHPSLTVTLGMTVVAALVFVAVAYGVSKH